MCSFVVVVVVVFVCGQSWSFVVDVVVVVVFGGERSLSANASSASRLAPGLCKCHAETPILFCSVKMGLFSIVDGPRHIRHARHPRHVRHPNTP